MKNSDLIDENRRLKNSLYGYNRPLGIPDEFSDDLSDSDDE